MTGERASVLLVEDDAPLRRSLAQWLQLNDLQVVEVASGREAMRAIEAQDIDVVLSDVRMQGMSGLELLALVGRQRPDLPTILLSGHGDVPMAVAAMQAGAFTFLTKPYVPEQLIGMLRNAIEQSRLRRRLLSLERSQEVRSLLSERLIGTDQATARLRAVLAQLAAYPVDVLIHGETGSGKEVVARLLHDCSTRRNAPYVAINCAAVPLDILESELFGHEAGAFTGAGSTRVGKFEFAQGGTLFLDEVESMPLSAQAKLLRVLQERSVTRLGSNREIAIDIRVVSATKESLAALAARGLFREDLYYRLMAAEIALPPLRERGHDAVLLFEHFMRSMAGRLGREVRPLGVQETHLILSYGWPGNVRQLKLLAERRALGLDWQPDAAAMPAAVAEDASLPERVDRFELSLIEQALKEADGKAGLAAGLLKIPHRTLNEKLKRLGRYRQLPGAG
ncbi:sigma-54-dependent transcriptional regulator [Radicibacter daui]|uniref:sigma-54-dependent transcriptional regulator n=1 Tax=Radicibacter daui TaxID=3064829 RepID=UPI00404698A4